MTAFPRIATWARRPCWENVAVGPAAACGAVLDRRLGLKLLAERLLRVARLVTEKAVPEDSGLEVRGGRVGVG